MKKRIVSLILTVALLMSAACSALADSYSATSRGFGGDVTVTLTVEGDQLTDVKAEGADETAGIGSVALEELPRKMLEMNSVEVDGVTGATFTSDAVLAAAAQALSQSGAKLAVKEAVEKAVYEDTYADVVVVGGGITGMSAAIAVANAGKSVIVLEKTDVLGGAATTSHSSVWAVGSELTKDKYDFTVDEIYEFFNKQAGPVYNKDVFYALANESYNTLHFLMDNGVVFEEVSQCNPQADPRFWRWSEASVDAGVLRGEMRSVFGWRLRVGREINARSLANFPMQANGAEMMRVTAIAATEAGLEVCCPVHDAFLIAAPLERLEEDVALMRALMGRAGRSVTGGFEVRTEAEVVRWPERYMDPRGRAMWERVMAMLDGRRDAA